MKGNIRYIYIIIYIYNLYNPNHTLVFLSGLPINLGFTYFGDPNPGFPFKTRGFPAKPGQTSWWCCPGCQYSHLTRISRICYTFSGSFVMNWCRPQTHDWPVIYPWRPMILLQKPLGLDPETRGFRVSPMFIPSPVTKPWWTRDLPVITRETKLISWMVPQK